MKGLSSYISFRILFVVADFVWKTKEEEKTKTAEYKVPSHFSNGRNNNFKNEEIFAKK